MAQKEVSLERIRLVLNQCIRIDPAQHVDMSNDEPHMDTFGESGFFEEYERHIRDIIQTLRSEQEPMDFTEGKSSRKRRILHPSTRRGSGIKLKKEEEAKLDAEVQNVKEEENCDTTTNCQVIQQRGQSEVQGHGLASCDAFDIDHAGDHSRLRTPIPEYISKHYLDRPEEVCVVQLGHQNPVSVLFQVLQEIETCSEIKQSECHCLQMKQISERLKCTILIFCTPGGDHEVYGNEYTNERLYVIVVARRETERWYYLVVVKVAGLYVYNLTNVPRTQFQPPTNVFVHTSDGACQGPTFSSSTTTDTVATIDTGRIVLLDNTVCDSLPTCVEEGMTCVCKSNE